jgi:transformation/transcription domain-associated protein
MDASTALPIAVQAIVALLFAVNHNCKDAPLQLARVLALLDNDTPTAQLGDALDRYGAQVPSWLWVAWVPQLLSLLSGPSASAARAILAALVLNFPQAVYFQLAAYKQLRASANTKFKGQLVTKNPTALVLPDGREVPVQPGTDARALKTLMRQAGATVTQDPHTEYRPIDFKVLQPPSLEEGATEAAAESTSSASPAASPTGSEGKTKEQDAPNASSKHAEQLMKQLLTKHGHVETLLYYFSDAVTTRLTSPGATARAPEEELLGLVDSIANRTLHALVPGMHLVPPRSAEALQRAFAQVFGSSSGANGSEAGKRSFSKFREQYRLSFARDLLPKLDAEMAAALEVEWTGGLEEGATMANPHFCGEVDAFLERLARWRAHLRAVLVRSWQHLMFQYSSFLADLHHSQLEVPGQYTGSSVLAASPSPKVRVMGMDPFVGVGTSPLNNIAQRTITVLGDDGRPYTFHVQAVADVITQSDARTAQQATLLNRLLASHHDSRSRQLSLTEPAVVSMSGSARLLAADCGATSVGAVADAWLARSGKSKDAPMQLFMRLARDFVRAERLGQPEGWEATREVKLAAAQAALAGVRKAALVPATALRSHIARSCMCPDVHAQIRARFSRQYGATALLAWAVNAHARSSHRLAISLGSGNATLMDTRPSFHPENGLLNARDSVPFRMTPQLQCFLTPFAVDGSFANSFTAAATALVGQDDWFRSHSTLYQRDELVAWRCRGKVVSDKRSREVSAGMRVTWLRNARGVVDKVTNMLPPEKVDLNKVPREWFSIKQHVLRIEEGAPRAKMPRPTPDALPAHDIVRVLCDGQVYELLAIASSDTHIAVMTLPWAPWL